MEAKSAFEITRFTKKCTLNTNSC